MWAIVFIRYEGQCEKPKNRVRAVSSHTLFLIRFCQGIVGHRTFCFMKKLWKKFSDRIFDLFFAKRLAKACDDLEHEDRYALQYAFIPELVNGISTGKVSIDDFLNIDAWKVTLTKIYGKGFFFRWGDFCCDICCVEDGITVIMLYFPKPMQAPDALYGAVLVNTTTNATAYYTLELALDGSYVLGSTMPGKRYNYGTVEEPLLQNFMIRVMEQRGGVG